MDKLAVVILNWNGIAYLKKFLGRVIECTTLPGSRIWVVDNGSDDGSAEWLEREYGRQISLLKFDENLGYAGGYAAALEKIEAEYYILLNSDIEVTPGWTEPLVEQMDNNRDNAACQPKILSWHERKKFEYAGAAGGFIDKYGYPFCRGRIFHVTEEDCGQYDDIREVFWASGACLMVRAEHYREAGGLSSRFFAHMEEIDLCWRMQMQNRKIAVVPSSVVYHVGGGTLSYNTPGKTYLNFRNNLFMLFRNLPEERLKSVLFRRRILDGIAALKYLLSFSTRHFTAIIRAHRDYRRTLPELHREREEIDAIIMSRDLPYSNILNKSIVWLFYIRRTRRFSSLRSQGLGTGTRDWGCSLKLTRMGHRAWGHGVLAEP